MIVVREEAVIFKGPWSADRDARLMAVRLEIKKLRKMIDDYEWKGVDCYFLSRKLQTLRELEKEGINYVPRF